MNDILLNLFLGYQQPEDKSNYRVKLIEVEKDDNYREKWNCELSASYPKANRFYHVYVNDKKISDEFFRISGLMDESDIGKTKQDWIILLHLKEEVYDNELAQR